MIDIEDDDETTGEPKPHPLFPLNSEDDAVPDIKSIHVMRNPDGYHHRAFRPEELTDLSQIYSMFGGGQYTLVGRNDRHITCRRTLTLDGDPKPLNPRKTPAPETPAPIQSNMGMGPETFFMAMMQMMQAQMKTSTEMMLAVMTGLAASSKEHIATMQALHDRHATQQTQLMTTIMQSNGGGMGGGGGMQEFLKGIEFARDWQSEEQESGELGELIESISPLVQGFMAHEAEKGGGNGGQGGK